MFNYKRLQSRKRELEIELDRLYKLKYAVEDEEEAEKLYGEEISELENEVTDLEAKIDDIYYAS